MTNATHTPGPWTAEYSDYGDEIWFGGYGAGMWTVEPVGAYLDGASQANARLIAAAPDLLAALENVIDDLVGGIEDCIDNGGSAVWIAEAQGRLAAARAVIAKAKGE